jgi:hypothetical protein
MPAAGRQFCPVASMRITNSNSLQTAEARGLGVGVLADQGKPKMVAIKTS